MQSSNIPSKIPLPFANAAGPSYVNTIPVASQIGVTAGRASLADGFPPLNFTPIASGGVPPFGGDMNGILKEITTIQQWQEAGGFFTYDSSFSTTIGGYPKGAILMSTSLNGLWISSIENNTNNPDTTGTGWISLSFEGSQSIALSATSTTLSYLQAAYPVLIFTGALTANSTVIVPAQAAEWIIVNNTTGAYTLTIKTASGTGVTVLQTFSTYIYCDGTNIGYANSAAVTSFNGRTGTISLTSLDVTNALGYIPAPINAPTFTGIPAAPTAAAGTKTTQLATTAFAMGAGIGSNQSWQDFTGSRAWGVNYTNTTGKPIFVNVSVLYGSSPSLYYFYVDGILVSEGGGSYNFAHRFSVGGIVPNGSVYQLYNGTGGGTIEAWAELR